MTWINIFIIVQRKSDANMHVLLYSDLNGGYQQSNALKQISEMPSRWSLITWDSSQLLYKKNFS